MGFQFSIGLTALQAAQQGLAIAGNNLTNATTPGYHRQVAVLSSAISTQYGGLTIGSGVSITDINRAISDQLESALTQQATSTGYTDARALSSNQIQTTISTGTTTPSTQLEGLLNKLQQLASAPTSAAFRQAAVTSASDVASAFNSAATDLSSLQQGLDTAINGAVTQVNSITQQIADLNTQIRGLSSLGGTPNDLLDKRGQLVNDLANLTSVQVQSSNDGQLYIIVAGAALVAGGTAQSIAAGMTRSGQATINVADSAAPLTITGGQIGGLLVQRNETLPDYQNRLDTLARQVASSFNAIQSTGLGGAGGFRQLTGQNGIKDTSVKLNAAGLSYPPQNGSLVIGVTDTATGKRTLTEVPINPQSQSLDDVATVITGSVPNMQAYVNGLSGTLSMIASNGYTLDFTGGYDTSPVTNYSGGSTATPTLAGTYTGNDNDNYTFTFTSGGTVGITPGLQVSVTDKTGTVVGTVDVGQGYQAGQPLTIGKGLTVSLGAGDVVTGDSFSSPISGNPDSAGLLPALGINTLFTGVGASTLKVNSEVVADPSRLSTSLTGQAGDVSNLKRFAALSDAQLMNNGKQTFSQFANQAVSDIGTQVQSLNNQQTTNQAVTSSIQNQQQAVSGVDTNEELANVLKYQQLYQAAGKYISAVNDALQQLMSLIN